MKASFHPAGRAVAPVLFCMAAWLAPVAAVVPGQLQYSIPSPPITAASDGELGTSVAMDGGYTVGGAPNGYNGGIQVGGAKVFDTNSGALLFDLVEPSPTKGDNFGSTVAISGTLVVVGAPSAANSGGPSGSGKAFVYDLGTGTPGVPIYVLDNPTPAANAHFGTAVAISGSTVVVGEPQGAGSAYVYDLSSATPTAPVVALSDPNPASSDAFGTSVAISGTSVVIGAPNDDTGATDAGSAYVYDLSAGTPGVPVATLHNPNPTASAKFGASVAIAGTQAVVGTPYDDTGVTDSGIAYAYDLAGATPATPLVTLHNPSPQSNAHFGWAVAMDGPHIVVSSGGGPQVGNAWLFDLSSATPGVNVGVVSGGRPPEAGFGAAVAISGTRAAAGVPDDSDLAGAAGSITVFDRMTAKPIVKLTAVDGLPAHQFGWSVSVSGTRIAVGMPFTNNPENQSGSVAIYDLASATPTLPVLILKDPDLIHGNLYFGRSVAIAGTRVVVGADGQNNATGSAFVFDLASANPTTAAFTLNYPGTLSFGASFGFAVAISGSRVAVGAYNDGTLSSPGGSAYVYDLASAKPTAPVATLHDPTPAQNDRFGSAVAIDGTHVLVGAYLDDTGATDAGSAYLYDLGSATSTVPVVTLNNPSPAAEDQFGWSLAMSGPRAVIGALYHNSGAPGSGAAYLYDFTSLTPSVPVATFGDPAPAVNDRFGYSVAISGTRVVVGSYLDPNATNSGRAYVYATDSITPTIPLATLNNPGPSASDVFGNSVAIDGTTAVVGAPYTDSAIADTGAIYIFGPAVNPNDLNNDDLLDSWEMAHFGDTAVHGIMDDGDQDGLGNLLEEAFGTDPTQVDSTTAPAVVVEDGYLTMTITKHPGVLYQVQSASNLNPTSFSATDTTVLIDDATTLKVRDNFLIGTTPGRFLRVKVMGAP